MLCVCTKRVCMVYRAYSNHKRYTWRLNNLIEYITGLIDNDRYWVYPDIPLHTIPGGGTAPPPPRKETRSSNYRLRV